jgi:DNA-binding response OmpR family regulator
VRLLLVEDDLELAELLRTELERAGFALDHAADGVDAEFLGNEQSYDVVVLDLGLPKKSGLEVLKAWRDGGNRTPVVILTARDAWHERVDGLKAGADDYVGKPFHVEELLARMHAVIRRNAGQMKPFIEAPGLQLDEDHQSIRLANGEKVELTGTEFRLIRYFMLNPGKILSKSRLTEHVYDQDFDRDSNLIEVYVRRLREKIGKERIITQRGQGYVFR